MKYLAVGYGDSLSVFNPTVNVTSLPKIYERMGSTSGYFRSIDLPIGFDYYDRFGNFLCYSDDQFPAFSLRAGACAPYTVGLLEAKREGGSAVFPNPANGVCYVNGKATEKVSFLTLKGQLLKEQVLQEGENQIDLQDLTPGIYLLHRELNGSSFYEKLISQ